MDRRKLLKLLSATVSVTAASQGLTKLAHAAGTQTNWGYQGAEGPGHWSDLSSDYQLCSQGAAQSPVDLQQPVTSDAMQLEFNYQPIPLNIVNNGHSIQVNCAPGNTLTLNRQAFELVQLHFHHPSEHLMTGQPFPMELHLVHRNTAGKLAVVGIFLQQGRANAVLQPIWRSMPTQAGPATVIADATLDLPKLLPANRQFESYTGSLTTPPCSEGVTWIVMEQPLEVSRLQVLQFARVMGMNARPVQALNQRSLLESP